MEEELLLGNINTTKVNKSKIQESKSSNTKQQNQNILSSNNEKNPPKIHPQVSQNSNKIQDATNHVNPRLSRIFDDSLNQIEDIESLDVVTKHEDLFSELSFEQLGCTPLLVACLKQRFKLEIATKVQSLSIPALLNGKDALIKSATGSGKTLAYSIPLVHQLQAIEPKIIRTSGLYSIIIVPTRELALQTYDCLDLLLQPYRRIVLSLLVGGEKKKSEKARLRKGINILVATPGRLLDHLEHTTNLRMEKLKWLIIDEADRLYEQGFSAVIGQIIEHFHRSCPHHIQTVLLSATLSKGVKELAGLSLNQPAIVDVHDHQEQRMDSIVLPDSLENCYMIVPPKLRLVILCCLLVKSLERQSKDGTKMIVFISCQDAVDYFATLVNIVLNKQLESIGKQLTILQLHGNMSQNDRTQTFKKFHEATHGILFCTDVVSRGLDMPNVDLVLQMSAPPLVEDYVHRVGRTARVGSKGRSILLLLPSETKFVHHLQSQLSIRMTGIKVESYFNTLRSIKFESVKLHTDQERLAYLHNQLEEEVYSDENMHQMGAKAYLSYLRSYASYPHKMSYCLPFKELHLGHLAKNFALRESPSQLGANFHRNHQTMKMNRKIKDISSLKRRNIPLEDKVSEFGGMITLKKEKRPRNQ
ncbi:hypothetical protein RDWZM_004411 [Blomia tropicalis]|uniref:ATP-dependent RNA helicase n=1 Tax=Blomia tropicalis TaxID=40697 RepID=A0A9Q0RTV7_BLOTA|nr:hypothetical protein RDWZM_004411 [Blomia tropicalis]